MPNRAELIKELRERALHLLAEMPHAEAAAERLMELAEERWGVKTGGQGEAAKRGPAKAAEASKGKGRSMARRPGRPLTIPDSQAGKTRPQGQQLEEDQL